MRLRFSIAFFGLLLLSMTACKSPRKEHSFKITGTLKGYSDGTTLLLLKPRLDAEGADTLAKATLSKEKFEMEGIMLHPDLVVLTNSFDHKSSPLFLESADIMLNGDVATPGKVKTVGSVSNDEFVRINQRIENIYAEQEQYQVAMQEAAMRQDTGKLDSLRVEMDLVYTKVEKAVKDYATANPNSYSAPFVIMNNIYYLDANAYNPISAKFTPEVKATLYGKMLDERLQVLTKTAVGKKAPEISGLDPAGEPISLYDSKGKITLIDFWASWCGPCRKENPKTLALYKKYHNKGLNIYGVSLDEDVESWKGAIEKDELTWNHVSDLKGWKSTYAQMYGVQAIPQTVLIDANGTILARNLFGKDLDAAVEKALK
jgi:thiol-disulfide isomerase/thioredoxin